MEKYNVVLDNLKEAQIYLPTDIAISQLMEKTKLALSSLQKTEQPLSLQIQSTPGNTSNNTTVAQNSADSNVSTSKDPGNTLGNLQVSLTEAKSHIMKLKDINKSTDICEQQVTKKNEVWHMLHPNESLENSNFDYTLSYEVDPKKKVPPEVEELGRLFTLQFR